MDSWHFRPIIWMCVLLACSAVSLVITALKQNSLLYLKFSNTLSNLVIHSTYFCAIPPLFLRYFIVVLEWVLCVVCRNNWRKWKRQTSWAQWSFFSPRLQMFCFVARILVWNLNWSITGITVTVMKITELKLLTYRIFMYEQVDITFVFLKGMYVKDVWCLPWYCLIFLWDPWWEITAYLVMYICMCTWNLIFLYSAE